MSENSADQQPKPILPHLIAEIPKTLPQENEDRKIKIAELVNMQLNRLNLKKDRNDKENNNY